MSLATREQKAVVTDFCACRALWFFHEMKERIRIRLNKERLTGHRGVYSNTISSIERCTYVAKAHTKPPQSCEERKPAPPDEEQFNAPTTGGCARHNASLLAVSNMSCYKVVGADYRVFSH